MILAGMVVVHNNGTLARVIFPPTEADPRVGVAFWLDDDRRECLWHGRLMQTAWHVEWIAYYYDDTEDTVQLRLW